MIMGKAAAKRRLHRAQALTPHPESDTPTRLLDVAERMFAERGFNGVSLREIVNDAEANIAAVHYHFGSKELLFQRVFARCAKPICRLTYERLEAAEEWAGHPQYLEQILKAHIVPTVKGLSDGSIDVRNYNRLRAHIVVENRAFAHRLLNETYADLAMCMIQALQRALPHLQPKQLAWRFHVLLGNLIFSTMPAGRVHTSFFLTAYTPEDPDEAIAFLVPLMAAMFRSPIVTLPQNGKAIRGERRNLS
jgi:AcrR family transcriptional regulator